VNEETSSIVLPFFRLAACFLALMAMALMSRSGQRLAAQFASGVNLVEVYATVTDAKGEVVTGLGLDDFLIKEDGRPQTISAFAAGAIPLTVAVAIDRSFSMARQGLASAKAAGRAFIRDLRAGDQVMIVAIGSDNEIIAPLSTDHAVANAALDRLEPWGTTPLFDAALSALDAVERGTGRRALLLLSDGDDRYSQTSRIELLDQARRKDVLVYPVTMGKASAPTLVELAAVTGGRSFAANEPREAQSAVAAIARELRLQYLIGYAPSSPREGVPGWRSIEVTVRRPNVRVRARDGYQSR
jgi:Ca-activated chloride channel family protein